MASTIIIVTILCMSSLIDAVNSNNFSENSSEKEIVSDNESNITDDKYRLNALDEVYSQCLLYLSYTCLQKKILIYINQLNNMSEVSFLGDHVKFVKMETIKNEDTENFKDYNNSEELSLMIDKSIDNFFGSHVLKVNAIGRDLTIPKPVEDFVGRKKRKGGGDGGGKGDDFGKKKMMMMAMMCMKMKFMMMVPAMMGMMGMMSFKGMMFSMMTFMISKMMLLMKILEKKGGLGGGGGGGDGGWAAGGGGGGAWMPAGGQDFGGGGGYDANGQWQSRSIFEKIHESDVMYDYNKPIISYIKPVVSYNNNIQTKKSLSSINKINDDEIQQDLSKKSKSRRKRSIMDVIHNAYSFWMSKVLGNVNVLKHANPPKYKVVNGVKYVYHPYRQMQKIKTPKQVEPTSSVTVSEALTPIVTIEDFNKGEIVEAPVIESRMNRKKFTKMKDTVNETVENNPWE